MSVEESNQPLIDLERQSPNISTQSSTGTSTDDASEVIIQSSISTSDRVRVMESAKLTLKEWIGVIMGALVIILLMAYLIYVLVTGPMLLNNAKNHIEHQESREFPDLTIVNYHPHLMIHEHLSPSHHTNNTLVSGSETDSKTRTDTLLSEYLLRDYNIHNSECIHNTCIHPKLVQAAKMRALHESEGFSSSEWLSNQSFKYSDLFEYDINVGYIMKSNCEDRLKWTKVVERIRNDPIRLERMKNHNTYGSYLARSNLVEIWVTSEKENCKFKIK